MAGSRQAAWNTRYDHFNIELGVHDVLDIDLAQAHHPLRAG
jgi:hypothetical protein